MDSTAITHTIHLLPRVGACVGFDPGAISYKGTPGQER